jgi:hypothetical protein
VLAGDRPFDEATMLDDEPAGSDHSGSVQADRAVADRAVADEEPARAR